MKTVEIKKASVEDMEHLEKSHFAIYNPEHKKGSVWFYEYDGASDCLNDGYGVADIHRLLRDGHIFIITERGSD